MAAMEAALVDAGDAVALTGAANDWSASDLPSPFDTGPYVAVFCVLT
jgi:hypothetical protein